MPIYNNEAMREIDGVVRRVQDTPGNIAGVDPYDRAAPSERPASFRNDSGGTIPAYGCMKLASGDKYSTGPPVPYFVASKPGATLLTDRFALNGPNPVASGDHGICYMSGNAKALYSTGTPAAGDAYGPTPGEWYLTKDYPPIFRVAVISDASPKHFYGELHPIELLRGELKEDMPTSGSVTAGQTAAAYFVDQAGDIVTAVQFDVTDEHGVYRGRANGTLSSPDDRGSQLYAKFMPDTEQWVITKMQPHALRISGSVSANVYYDDSEVTLQGTPQIMSPSGALAMEDLTTTDLIKNPYGLQFATNDFLDAEWNEDASPPGWEAVLPGRPRPHRISGEAGSAVYATTTQFTLSGTPVIMNPIDAISEEDYTASNLIKNPLGLVFANGADVHAEYNDSTSQWEAVGPSDHIAKWLIGTATNDFLTGGAITIDSSPTYKDGIDPASDPSTVANPCGRTGNSGATVVALHDGDGSYTAIDVSHVAETFVTEVTVNGTTFKLQDKTRASSIMPRGAESSLTDIHTGTDCS